MPVKQSFVSFEVSSQKVDPHLLFYPFILVYMFSFWHKESFLTILIDQIIL
jgi:hypothetical protein